MYMQMSELILLVVDVFQVKRMMVRQLVLPRGNEEGSIAMKRRLVSYGVILLTITFGSIAQLAWAAPAQAAYARSAAPMSRSIANTAAAAMTGARRQVGQTRGAHLTNNGQVTVIVLDMSGSMSSNDPDGLRCSAANAYISLSGVGDYVGVIGLDNSTHARGGSQNFEQAQVWAQPADMSTLAARNGLISTIATKSNNCHPDVDTPTYDALNQALSMLTAATAHSGRTGSVILLTDGVPYPDTQSQLDAIKNDLRPKFQAAGFPVDTIALGADAAAIAAHPFLQALSNATSGNFYDDARGVISGTPDALNIAPFFVDIFALRNHRTPGPTVAPTNLSGGVVSQDLQVPAYVSHLDVIVVKDTSTATVTLTTPSGQSLPPAVAGTLVATDPHYAIFSIDGGDVGVEQGAWQVNVTGTGRFLVDSLFKSNLALGITSPAANVSALPLGQNLTISATLFNGQTPIAGSGFSVSGTITSNNLTASGAPYTQDITLAPATPGLYQATVNVPETAPSGAYTITVNVTQISATVISSAARKIRLEIFPTPLLLSGQPLAPTTATAHATVTQWDPGLQILYSLPIVSWFSGPPLENLPARPTVDIPGEVTLHNQLYTQAIVTGYATPAGSKQRIPVQVVNTGKGNFSVLFPAPVGGVYTIVFMTSGSFADSHGDFGATTRTAQLAIVPATPAQEIRAWVITLLVYPFILWLLYFIALGYWITPKPAGKWTRTSKVGASEDETRDFARSHSSNLFRAIFHPDQRTSRDVFRTEGALLVFRRGGAILARSRGRGRQWTFIRNTLDDASEGSAPEKLTERLQPVKGLAVDDTVYTFDTSSARGANTQRGGGSRRTGNDRRNQRDRPTGRENRGSGRASGRQATDRRGRRTRDTGSLWET